jgi:hypothetical protein
MEDRFLLLGGKVGDQFVDAVGAADLVADAVSFVVLEVVALEATRAVPAIDDFSAHKIGRSGGRAQEGTTDTTFPTEIPPLLTLYIHLHDPESGFPHPNS